MKLHSLPRLLLGTAFLGSVGLGSTGCQSQAAHVHDHWTGYSVGPSLSRAFLSYNAEKQPSYREFAWRKKKDIELTLRRHFFNHNPENPFEPNDNSYYEPRPNHSLVPHANQYIHVEGIVIGTAFLAGGGVFFPMPVDSIIGTFEEGGTDEFMRGVDEFTHPMAVVTTSFLHDALNLPEKREPLSNEQ